MKSFAELLDRLLLTPSRNAKLRLMAEHFRNVPDPNRGLALAALTGNLSFASVKPAMLRTLVAERMDPVLFSYSYVPTGRATPSSRSNATVGSTAVARPT